MDGAADGGGTGTPVCELPQVMIRPSGPRWQSEVSPGCGTVLQEVVQATGGTSCRSGVRGAALPAAVLACAVPARAALPGALLFVACGVGAAARGGTAAADGLTTVGVTTVGVTTGGVTTVGVTTGYGEGTPEGDTAGGSEGAAEAAPGAGPPVAEGRATAGPAP